MIYQIVMVYSPPEVGVEFTGGGTSTDDAFAHVLAWVESDDGCPKDCVAEMTVSFPPGETLALGVSAEHDSIWGLILFLPSTNPIQLFSTLVPACFDEFFVTSFVNPGGWGVCSYLYDLETAQFHFACDRP